MTNTADYCIKIINKLYEEVSGFAVSAKDREKVKLVDSSLTYGELTDQSLVALLKIVDPKPGEVFYDLGSGAGKPVLWASVLYEWRKCCGIELLPGLSELSLLQAQKVLSDPDIQMSLPNKQWNMEFLNEDFLNCDLQDANVIVMNATAFSYDLWQKVTEKCLKLPIGVRIILMTKTLSHDAFSLIHSGMHLMSWGMNSVNIYEKVKSI